MALPSFTSFLRHPLVPFIAGAAVLAVAGIGSMGIETGDTELAALPPKTDAYAAAELTAPPAPGSFAVADLAIESAAPLEMLVTADCVTRLQETVAPLRLSFAQGSTTVSTDQVEILSRLGTQISECTEAYVMVAGHADGDGPDETNMALSWARADDALNTLVSFGVDPGAVEAIGYGATTPLAQGSDEEDPADRRVEFHVFQVRTSLP